MRVEMGRKLELFMMRCELDVKVWSLSVILCTISIHRYPLVNLISILNQLMVLPCNFAAVKVPPPSISAPSDHTPGFIQGHDVSSSRRIKPASSDP